MTGADEQEEQEVGWGVGKGRQLAIARHQTNLSRSSDDRSDLARHPDRQRRAADLAGHRHLNPLACMHKVEPWLAHVEAWWCLESPRIAYSVVAVSLVYRDGESQALQAQLQTRTRLLICKLTIRSSCDQYNGAGEARSVSVLERRGDPEYGLSMVWTTAHATLPYLISGHLVPGYGP